MTELILHHYPNSPFAEKIRLILGAKKQSWHSVAIPMIMPKPDLVALTGGYRRTPVMQIGADIYCDTALICDVLEHLAPTPALYPAAQRVDIDAGHCPHDEGRHQEIPGFALDWLTQVHSNLSSVLLASPGSCQQCDSKLFGCHQCRIVLYCFNCGMAMPDGIS